MQTIDIAILKTIIYGDIFNFPMTVAEVHHFLIHDESIPLTSISNRIEASAELNQRLCNNGIYYALAHRRDLLSLRTEREQMMSALSDKMAYYGQLLSYFPFVELVGITGALAMRNPSSAHDDLDYIVITYPGRVWLARAFIILLVKLIRLRNIEICPNYVLASDQLIQSRQDLYIAHEIAQVLPINNHDLYLQFRNQNRWSNEYLPNANLPLHNLQNHSQSHIGMLFKRAIEFALKSRLGDWLEHWEYERKARRFERQAQAPTASAQIDEGHVKGHFNDYGHHVIAQFQARLEEYGLTNQIVSEELQCVGD